jgi:isocitrate dehydrogenase kinase/phosphatase
MNKFKQYMLATYDQQELKEISENGCVSGCAGTLIYYADTSRIYNEYADDIHAIIGDYMESTGQDTLPQITANIGDGVSFRNDMVWLAAELIAWDATNESEAA